MIITAADAQQAIGTVATIESAKSAYGRHQRVIAILAQQRITPAARDQVVIATAAIQRVIAKAAINGVIAVGAINRIIAAIDAGPTGPAIIACAKDSTHTAH